MDLFRAGVPSIGEVYRYRWSSNRGTGGLGTGVYCFRTAPAARENIDQTSPDRDFYAIRNAVENPIQPTSFEATRSLNRLSRQMDLLRSNGALDMVREEGETVNVSLGSRGGIGSGPSLGNVAWKVLLDTPALREKYGYDSEAFVMDFVDATEEAAANTGGFQDPTGSQPLNYLLWPDFDGVAPTSDAGGDDGTYGCVILKERIDACVDRETEQGEQVPAERLNDCFAEA
jgi:hypothetical protein